MMFLWLPFLLLIPFGFMWFARSGAVPGCCGMAHDVHAGVQAPGADAKEIARQRLARGEITPSEYEEIIRVLG